jgi:hypothetical protein
MGRADQEKKNQTLDDPTLDDLADKPFWVTWRTEERNGKPTKVPFNPETGREAKSNDPKTWSTRSGPRSAATRWARTASASCWGSSTTARC